MSNPTLTVAMPVYNGEKYLTESISSVLNQTFNDFEFIIINDGSTDTSVEIIKTYKDPRIVFIDNEQNKGIPFCRNLSLEKARGEFLAWTDCDDVNEPTRFEEQINFLERNTEMGICGSFMRHFGKREFIFSGYTNSELVKATLFFKPSIPNPTVMFRLSKIREHHLRYDHNLPIAEDYDFVFRCSLLFPVININKILYHHRASETSIMAKYKSQAKESESNNIYRIVNEKILNTIGIVPSNTELKLHRSISSGQLFKEINEYKQAYQWLVLLKKQNKENGLYLEKAFETVVADQFYFISKKASQLGLSVFFFYINHSRKTFRFASISKVFKLFARCLIKYNKF